MNLRKYIASVLASFAMISSCMAVTANAETVSESWLWNKLVRGGYTDEGTAAIIANLKAESNLQTDNLEDTFEAGSGMTDVSYVQGVDNGTYTNFVDDAAGFGLSQTTYYSRKRMLLNMAKERGVSIADPDLQADFIMAELESSFPNLAAYLHTTHNTGEAAARVMAEYENPEDQSDSAVSDRKGLAYAVYDRNKGSTGTWTEQGSAGSGISVGDVVFYSGTRHHVSAFDTGEGSYCGSGEVTILDINGSGTYRYYAKAVSGSNSVCCGWISGSDITAVGDAPETPPAPVNTNNVSVGTILVFDGSKQYESAYSTDDGDFCTPGTVKVTGVVPGSNYPYHVVGVDGCSCYGWVSGDDLSFAE